MRTRPSLVPKPRFPDPRKARSFRPVCYPKANSQAPPSSGSRDRNDRIRLEFLAAYYQLNCEYAGLLAIRRTRDKSRKARLERPQMQKIERALRRRDALEDHYAPFGVIAEPVMHKGFAVDLKFTFGNVNAQGQPRSEGCTFSAFVPIPLPAAFKVADLFRHLGRGAPST